jgi:mannose-6-phosphate isomerase-like protein (cupin superfamily)
LVFEKGQGGIKVKLPTFEVPPIGPRQGKIWGVTQLLFHHNNVECHRIHAVRGGYCSQHSHEHKWNRFVVLSGRLAVRIFHNGKADETILGPGHVTDVPPGVVHQFEALEDVEALEIYWVLLEASDIDRGGTEGGINQEAISCPQDNEVRTH